MRHEDLPVVVAQQCLNGVEGDSVDKRRYADGDDLFVSFACLVLAATAEPVSFGSVSRGSDRPL